MRAVWYERNGPSGVLEIGEMPNPEAGAGEVRVQLVTSGINPSDWKRRAGLTRPRDFPRVIPHQDGAGIIDQIGSGVPQSRLGQRVWLYEAQTDRPFGTAADYTVQPGHQAVPFPDNTTFAEAACLGVPAMTAHRCVFADGPVSGKTILVPGGAGAVGNYAIQFAKLDGAKVITTVSSEEKGRLAMEAGAEEVINYRSENSVERILEVTHGAGVDHIVEVDFAGNFQVSQAVLRNNGVVAVYAAGTAPQPTVPLIFNVSNVTVRLVLVYTMPEPAKEAAVADITHLLEEGKLRHLLGPKFPLESAVDAHDAVEGGAIGNVILEVGEPTSPQ